LTARLAEATVNDPPDSRLRPGTPSQPIRPTAGLSSCSRCSGWAMTRHPASRLLPRGVERPRRVVRFARLIHRRDRGRGRTFGPRRLRWQSQACPGCQPG
jgi:hypothetical protein